jgi:hypothetical protein
LINETTKSKKKMKQNLSDEQKKENRLRYRKFDTKLDKEFVCVCEREREREREKTTLTQIMFPI